MIIQFICGPLPGSIFLGAGIETLVNMSAGERFRTAAPPGLTVIPEVGFSIGELLWHAVTDFDPAVAWEDFDHVLSKAHSGYRDASKAAKNYGE